MNFKPLLAATLVDPERLKFPLLGSPKLDGIRCITMNGTPYSRNLKVIRNAYVQQELRNIGPMLDGELVVGEPNTGHVLNRTQSGVMSADGSPDFTYWVFDSPEYPAQPFLQRFHGITDIEHPRIKFVEQTELNDYIDLLGYEQDILAKGYEGIMLRSMEGHYKHGRSTGTDGLLWKLKRFTDWEGVVVRLEEGMNNSNILVADALGRAKRSSHQENLIPNGQVGTMIVLRISDKTQLPVSPGRMTHDKRKHYWENPNELIGATVKCKSFEYGSLAVPRFSTYQAHRDPEDM